MYDEIFIFLNPRKNSSIVVSSRAFKMDPQLKLLIAIAIMRRRRAKRRSIRYWIHPIVQLRGVWGEHLKLDEMKRLYPLKFFEYTRMKPSQFDDLLLKIHPIKFPLM